MRISSQNNQFIFNFPTDFISEDVENRLMRYMDKNFIPYIKPLDYISSTIQEIVFPGIQYQGSEQIHKFGKKIEYKPAQNIFDTFTPELDITLRSVDSHTNYFMLHQILSEYYNNTRKYYFPWLDVSILDKDGDIIYVVKFKSVTLKSLSENRLAYQVQDISQQTFSMTFHFNFVDIDWELRSLEDGREESIFDTETWDHSGDFIPQHREQNEYNFDKKKQHSSEILNYPK